MSDCCTLPPPTCYSCDSSVWKCTPNRAGSQALSDCYDKCQCVTPHNCGQLNGTVACGAAITGCSVCGMCCKPYITEQASCDGCFAAPAPNGCGNQTNPPTPAPTPTMYSCNATAGCVVDPKGSLSPGECIATCNKSGLGL